MCASLLLGAFDCFGWCFVVGKSFNDIHQFFVDGFGFCFIALISIEEHGECATTRIKAKIVVACTPPAVRALRNLHLKSPASLALHNGYLGIEAYSVDIKLEGFVSGNNLLSGIGMLAEVCCPFFKCEIAVKRRRIKMYTSHSLLLFSFLSGFDGEPTP